MYDGPIIELRLWSVEITPDVAIAVPRAEGGFTVIAAFPLTVVTLRDEAGRLGTGVVIGGPDVRAIVCELLDAGVVDTATLLRGYVPGSPDVSMSRDRARTEPKLGAGASRQAAHAVLALAAWDLAGLQQGRACADLFGDVWGEGARARRRTVETYYSSLFSDRSPAELREEAEAAQALGFGSVKMRPGRTTADDVERISSVAAVFSAPRTIALDAVFGWDVARVDELGASLPLDLMWLEDPFPYDGPGLRSYREVGEGATRLRLAAGEACGRADELVRLVDAGGVRLPLLDVGCLGGPVNFIAVAHRLAAQGATVGSHLYDHYSCHLLGFLDDSLPVELADWLDPPFVAGSRPASDGSCAVMGPGFGLGVDYEMLAATSTEVARWTLALEETPADAAGLLLDR